jgi:DNA-directed RNA polymerase subunit RPC12/RpoP
MSTTRSLRGARTLAEANSTLTAEWHPTKNDRTPTEVAERGAYRAWWVCATCDWEWVAPVCNRSGGSRCPLCTNRITVAGINDLATLRPDLMQAWAWERNTDLDPTTLRPQSAARAWWRCSDCAYEWQTTISNRYKGKGCGRCAGHVLEPGINDLASQRPELAAEWHPTRNDRGADAVFAAGAHHAWWQCATCEHEWAARVNNRAQGAGCPACGGHVLIPGSNDLASQAPLLAQAWHPTRNGDLTPDQVRYGSKRRVWWLCPSCNHEWEADVKQRVHGKGCPGCASRGFNAADPARLYFLQHATLRALKVGVTNLSDRRLNSFKGQGWRLLAIETFPTGAEALAVERVIHNWWRDDLALPIWLGVDDMRGLGGHTETICADELSEFEVISRIKAEAKRILAGRETQLAGTEVAA